MLPGYGKEPGPTTVISVSGIPRKSNSMGKTLGVIGFGHTGSAVAALALAFGMHVLAYTSKKATQLPAGVTKATLDDLFAHSDIVSVHAPLTAANPRAGQCRAVVPDETDGHSDQYQSGPLVDEEALAAALNQGKIRAAGLDVLSSEPLTPTIRS